MVGVTSSEAFVVELAIDWYDLLVPQHSTPCYIHLLNAMPMDS